MPELPEVTTTMLGLREVIVGKKFVDVWTDLAKKNQPIKQFEDTIKSEIFFKYFRKQIIGTKITKVERRAKNILIHLANNKIILIHLKMTGHLLYGKYNFSKEENKWTPDVEERESLKDPYNRFVHVVFTLSNGKQIAFCDSRKFGKITLLDILDISRSKHLKDLGTEPLDSEFSFDIFTNQINKKSYKKIKTALMDQSLVVGIGNIYSDEILWAASVHPDSKISQIPAKSMQAIFNNTILLLNKGISFGGDSMSDYRNINGEKGKFQGEHNAYRRKSEKCKKKSCRGVIERKIIDGRSAHFCNIHQKLYIKNGE